MNRTLKSLSALSALALSAATVWAQAGEPAPRPGVVGAQPPIAAPPAATRPAADEVAFTLNGKKFTEGDLIKSLRRLIPNGTEISDDQLYRMAQSSRRQLIDAIVEEQLLQQEAAEHHVTVTDKDVDARVEEMVEGAMKTQGVTREQLDQQMKEQMKISLDEQVKKIKTDPRLRKQIMLEKLSEELFKDVELTDKEVREAYEDDRRYAAQVRASHILIRPEGPEPEQKEAARKKAEEILTEVKKEGADFAKLAQENSACPSKVRGGDLGFFPRKGAMVEPFAEAAFKLKPGEISDIVETNFGFHIIKVTEIRPAKDFDAVKDDVREDLKTRKQQMELREHLQELRAKAEIKYPPGKEPATQPAFSMTPQRRPTAPPPARPRPGAQPEAK